MFGGGGIRAFLFSFFSFLFDGCFKGQRGVDSTSLAFLWCGLRENSKPSEDLNNLGLSFKKIGGDFNILDVFGGGRSGLARNSTKRVHS